MQARVRRGQLRIITLADAPGYIDTLAKWHHQQWQALNPGQTLEQRLQKMQRYLAGSFIPGAYVACDGRLLGSAAIVECDMDSRPELSPWLASVYVDFPYRREGIGSMLVQHVIEQASLQGIKRLYLFTPDQVAFYQQLGWQVLETTTYRDAEVTVMYIDLV
jgi:N-acetylglutamate synthase-like GNAT family acetyltransferase